MHTSGHDPRNPKDPLSMITEYPQTKDLDRAVRFRSALFLKLYQISELNQGCQGIVALAQLGLHYSLRPDSSLTSVFAQSFLTRRP